MKKIFNSFWLVVLLIFVAIGLLVYLKLGQFYAFTEKFMLDFGEFNNAFYSTAHLKGFFSSDLTGQKMVRELGQEGFRSIFSQGENLSIVFFLLPFYWLFSRPETLIFLQITILSFGALPVYWLTKKCLKSPPLALLFVFFYLFYPILDQMILSSDGFRPEALSVTFLLFALWFFEEKKFFKFFVTSLLALVCSLTVLLPIFLIGLWALLKKMPSKWFLTCFVSSGVLAILWLIIIPRIIGTPPSFFAKAYYSHLGSSSTEVIRNIIIHPFNSFKIIFTSSNLAYLNKVFQPFGYLPLLGLPWLLLSVPNFLKILLIDPHSGANTSNIFIIYYLAPIVPFIFLGLIKGLGLVKKNKIIFAVFLLWLFASFTYTFIFYSPLFPLSQTYRRTIIKDPPMIWQMIKRIPSSAAVATNNIRYLGVLSNREKIILFNSPEEKVVDYPEYVLFNVGRDAYLNYEVHPKLRFVSKEQAEKWFLDHHFRLIDRYLDLLLFKKEK